MVELLVKDPLIKWRQALAQPETRNTSETCCQIQIRNPLGFSFVEEFPVPVELLLREPRLVRLLAAEINNIAMIYGGGGIQFCTDNQSLADDVLREIHATYPQVQEVSMGVFGRYSLDIAGYGASRIIRVGKDTSEVPNFGWFYPVRLDEGTNIGINIGQSQTKAATVRNGVLIRGTERVIPTWQTDSTKSFDSLLRNVTEIINEQLRLTSGEDIDRSSGGCDGIGICVGGIVYEGHIAANSGITLGMESEDVLRLNNMSTVLFERYGLPIAIAQDVVAKAYFLTPELNLRRALILDIGTSTGGVFVDEQGRIPKLLNQIGRIVIDLSDSAIARPDGKAKGVLSQYLSAIGLQQILTKRGISLADLSKIDNIPQDISNGGQDAEEDFTELLLTSLRTLVLYYDYEQVVITGGVMQGEFGQRVIARAQDSMKKSGTDVAAIRMSPQPMVDGCIGVAFMASSHQA